MKHKQFLIGLAASTALLCAQAVAQYYTPAEGFYDLSGMPETGMYPKGGPKPGSGKPSGPPPGGDIQKEEIQVGPATFTVNYPIFDSFDALPDDVDYTREPIKSFTRPEGGTHYYEVVLVNSMNVSWVQAAILAKSEGGYLASLTSAEENAFVFGLVDDGVIDRDPRDNTQPNGKGRQNVMGFGELNVPVPTWGDYWDTVAQYGKRGKPSGYNMGFIIEYDEMPK